MSSYSNLFPMERFDEIQLRPEDFRLLERVPFTKTEFLDQLPYKLHDVIEGERTFSVVFLDTETTGLDFNNDKIIELGMVRATYSLDRRMILSINKIYNEFEDPKMPIPPKITDITGITDSMVAAKQFDIDQISQMLVGRPLIVAHNAAFDRPFFDKRFEMFSNLSWACSYNINWEALGNSGKKLEFLLQSRGWFYEAHRACEDCLALIWLMHIEQDSFSMIIDEALTSEFYVFVLGNTYEIKDKLKSLGYKFDGNKKRWYTKVYTSDDVKRQIETIGEFYDKTQVRFVKLSAFDRFKV